jgi:nitroimidazol reductase NimA-like FMN-containing flavoprotein (pyridoxamine 5'-phosphate oxidase superfamily)
MEDGRRAVEVLDTDECMALLGNHAIGRVGLSVNALPVILPVNYLVDGERILLRTGFGTKLAAAVRNAVVCFEIDELDQHHHVGWSVVVTGTARELVGAEAARAATMPLRPWSPGVGDHLVAIDVELVSGRRITQPAVVPA